MTRAASLLLVLAPALSGCGDSPTGLTAGTQLSVAEQVAVEPALADVVETLRQSGGTPVDTLIADYLAMAARLVRLQGRAAAVAVDLGGAAPQPMQAVALLAVDRRGPTPQHVQLVVAWSGLDPSANRLERALVLLAEAGAAPEGTFSLSLAGPSGGRLVHYRRPEPGTTVTDLYYVTEGSTTAAGGRFRGGCPGLQDGADSRCETGRETTAGSLRASLGDALPDIPIVWTAAIVPAFRLTQH